MPSFGAASRADGDTRFGVSLRCIQDRERRGRERVRGDIVHQRVAAPLSAGSITAAERGTWQPLDFCDLSRKTSGDPPAAAAPKRLLLLRLAAFRKSAWKPAGRIGFGALSLQTAEQRRLRRSKAVGWLVNNRRRTRTERSCPNL